jgi:hypothetical protein
MSKGVDDGITLPKITKCADIKRKKTVTAYRHRGVVTVVTLSRHCPLHLRSVGDQDPDPYVFGPPGSGSIRQRYDDESGSIRQRYESGSIRQRYESGSGSRSFPLLINVLSLQNKICTQNF